MSTPLPIGGFFPLELPGPNVLSSPAAGLLHTWTQGRPFAAYGNARSALAALIAQHKPAQVWLPAFLCTVLTDAVAPALQRFYAIDGDLRADLDALAQAAPGDLVLGVNYFGCGPDAAFLRWVATRPDLVLVEDCAQDVVPGAAWGQWRLFSPRKVVGVADGGILVGLRPAADPPQPASPAADAALLWRAPLLRFEDPQQQGSVSWHAANQAREAAMRVSDHGATRLSLALLARYDAHDIALRRRANFAVLQAALGTHQLPLRAHAHSVPFAFPVRVAADHRDAVLRQLHAQGVYAAVHWSTLPVAAADFPQAHQLAQTLISLPCDQRYEAAHMHTLAAIFLQALA